MTPPHEHRQTAPARCFVLTISDTRTPQTDTSGTFIRDSLLAAGHSIAGHEILRDEPAAIAARIAEWCDAERCDAIILTGGTGLAPRDTTSESVSGLLEKRIDGFGELFRMLSYVEIGSAAMLSRAVAGIRRKTAIFSLPGSTPAVRLGMEKLILPQLRHIVELIQ